MGESKQTAQDQFDPRPYQKEWKRKEAAYRRVLQRQVHKARSFLPRLVSTFLELDPELEKVVLFGSLARGIPRQLEFEIDVGVRSKHYFRLLSGHWIIPGKSIWWTWMIFKTLLYRISKQRP